MGTIVLNKENFGQKMSVLYKKINTFGEVKINIEEKNRLKGLSKEEIESNFYDEKTESYGPFVGEENTTFLKAFMK